MKFFTLSTLATMAFIVTAGCSGQKIETLKGAICCDGGFEYRHPAAWEKEQQRLKDELAAAQNSLPIVIGKSPPFAPAPVILSDRRRLTSTAPSRVAQSWNGSLLIVIENWRHYAPVPAIPRDWQANCPPYKGKTLAWLLSLR